MISLSKGQTINLKKTLNESSSNTGLSSICLGVDWGKIKKGWFGSSEDVDLDATVIIYDASKSVIDEVSFRNPRSSDYCIKHSGDDRGGDDVSDGRDNEVIYCDLENISQKTKHLALVLNSFSGQDFGDLPYVSTRVYTGTKDKPVDILGSMNLANDPVFKSKTAMVMAILTKGENGWEYKAVGEPTSNNSINGLARDAIKFI